MRLIFLGSGEFGLPTLRMLHEQHEIIAAISQPDKPAGRKRKLTPTPIAQWSVEQNLPLHRFENVNTDEVVEQVRQLNADAAVIIAFGQKLGDPLINAMGKLAVNLHASLLPKYRGAAPINWAMASGETITGVSVIGLAQRMDAGDVYARRQTEINPMETAGELHDRLAELGPDAIASVLDDLQFDKLNPQQQDESLATLAPKLSKASGMIDFSEPAEKLRCHIHGMTPWPGVTVQWTKPDEQPHPFKLLRVRVDPTWSGDASPGTVLPNHRVATGDGALELLEVQPPGKRGMSMEDFSRGHDFKPGDRLSGS